VSRLVVKVGGAVAFSTTAEILGLVADGHDVVVVHGAGPQISTALERAGIEAEFVRGRRVTSADAVDVVRRTLTTVNAGLCVALGPTAVGFSGDEIGLRARRLAELGHVGAPLPSCPEAIVSALADRRLPVVAPLAVGPLNVNADEMAAALATGMDADRIVFLTDVAGLLLEGVVVPRIEVDEAEALLREGLLEGGILPKLRAAVAAARVGVRAEIGETAVVA
jgi:acetylglutamate kinase